MDYHDLAGKMRMPPWMSDSSVAPSEPVIEEMARSMLGVDALPQDLKEMLGKLKAYSKPFNLVVIAINE